MASGRPGLPGESPEKKLDSSSLPLSLLAPGLLPFWIGLRMCAGKEGSSEGEKRSCELALPPFHFPLLHPLLAAQATFSLFWSFLDPLPRPPVRARSIAQNLGLRGRRGA